MTSWFEAKVLEVLAPPVKEPNEFEIEKKIEEWRKAWQKQLLSSKR